MQKVYIKVGKFWVKIARKKEDRQQLKGKPPFSDGKRCTTLGKRRENCVSELKNRHEKGGKKCERT